jgi:hypothetical protein
VAAAAVTVVIAAVAAATAAVAVAAIASPAGNHFQNLISAKGRWQVLLPSLAAFANAHALTFPNHSSSKDILSLRNYKRPRA